MILVAAAFATPPLSEAEAMPEATPSDIGEYKPIHHMLPPAHRGQTDYTAYTLELGEVRLGIESVGIGILPRTHVSTQPVLDALGAPNVGAKVNALRIGGFDLAATGTWGAIHGETLDAAYLGAGGAMSLQIAKPWSIHASASWQHAEVAGTPQLDGVASLLAQQTGVALPTTLVDTLESALVLDAEVEAVTAKVATDVRLNRRDSIVLQAESMVWSSVDAPAVLEGVVEDRAGFMPVTEVWSASLAWQLTWRHLDVRVGAGVSSIPGAWLLNTVDVSYRFGGPTRVEERRMLSGWRQNRREVAKAARNGTQPETM